MIQQNIAEKSRAVEAARAHCMCLHYSPGFITFPEGYRFGGVRFLDTANGHRQALDIMEREWQESFPKGAPHAV